MNKKKKRTLLKAVPKTLSFISRIYFDENCSYCLAQKEKQNTFYPPHEASSNCESGKRNHCTCDTCF